MSGSVNRVFLIGNLGADPEVRSFQSGGRVCNFSIATSQTWKDKNTGEKRERTEWHRISIFADGIVGVAEKYLRKGSKVCVQGQLETRKWQDQSGADRYATEVVLRPYAGELTLLGDGGGRENSADRSPNQAQGGGYGGGSATPDIDDRIPF